MSAALRIGIAALTLAAATLHADPPEYSGEVCLNGSTVTVSVASTPPATAILIYPNPPGGGYFMTNDGTGTFESSFNGLSDGQSFSFHLVIQVPQQYGPLDTHNFTLSPGCTSFASDGSDGGDTGGGDNGGGGPGSGGPLPNRGFRHDVVQSGNDWAIQIETASPTSPIPAVTNVDVMYRVNNGALQTATMQPLGNWFWAHDLPGVTAGDELKYTFTETIGAALVDTSWFERTVGEAAPPPPTFPIVTTGAARFRDRHENEWRFDHYVAGYDIGRTFDVTLTDHGDELDVELTTRPEVVVNDVDLKWYNISGPAVFCDRNISAIGVRMNKSGNVFTYTIPDLVVGQRVDFEFTLLSGQTYYSEFLHYYIGEGKFSQKRKHPLQYAVGDASISAVSVKQFAFNQHALNLSPDDLRTFIDGKIFFETRWDDGLLFNPPTAFDCNGGPVGFNMGASPVFDPGELGPLYSNNSCIECHMLDGRGAAPNGPSDSLEDMVIRLSTSSGNPHPVYGTTLDQQSVGGVPTEGTASVQYELVNGTFDDGTPYELRRPVLSFDTLNYGPLGNDTDVSLRIAPMLIGLGLLEAVSDADILAFEDELDANGDGISGRANIVDDRESGGTAIGRFGWKAGQPNLRQQAAAAFRDDMGMTSSLYPSHDCTPSQPECGAAAPSGLEVSDSDLDQLETYLRGLTVPPRENFDDPQALMGQSLFNAAGCASCHRPIMKTSPTAEFAPFRDQTFQPFTDLLLHDMGPDLADGRAEFGASGSEWRTPPLWALAYVGNVLTTPTSPFNPNEPGPANFLHDGRARTLMEAILWHGGEAASSRDAVLAMTAAERDALIAYVEFPFVDPGEIIPCPCEFAGDPDIIEVQDLLAFLALWFAGDLAADFDESGAIGINDLLGFLSCWFEACPQ